MPHDDGLTYGSPIVTKLRAELPAGDSWDSYTVVAALGDALGELRIEHHEAIEAATAELHEQVADLRERLARCEGALSVLTGETQSKTQSKRAAPRTRSRQSVSNDRPGNVVKFS